MRGLKAPPRRSAAPARRTARAVSKSISRFSTEQGPAITTSALPPIVVPPPTSTIVGSGLNSRETSL